MQSDSDRAYLEQMDITANGGLALENRMDSMEKHMQDILGILQKNKRIFK